MKHSRPDDHDSVRKLAASVARERETSAQILAYIAEIDARRLYLAAGYGSMYEYCVGQLGVAEDSAFEQVEVARIARRFPSIFPALADGRLHMAGVRLLAPHLSEDTAEALLAAAVHKTETEIHEMLDQRIGT